MYKNAQLISCDNLFYFPLAFYHILLSLFLIFLFIHFSLDSFLSRLSFLLFLFLFLFLLSPLFLILLPLHLNFLTFKIN